MTDPIPPESILADPGLREPDGATPLTFQLGLAEARKVRELLGLCPHDRVRALIAALDELARPGKWPITWSMPYRDYRAILGVFSELPYVRVARAIHELARQAEHQLHAAMHLETYADNARAN